MKRTLVIGDIHWGYKSLMQCLERSKFDYENDELICLWDVVDWWPDSFEVVEELLKIKNLIYISGNHDEWCRQWLTDGSMPQIWTTQWGDKTISSYLAHWGRKNKKHLDFFNSWLLYCIHKNRLFVHGGLDLRKDIEKQTRKELEWNRELYYNRNNDFSIEPYKEIYVGHTSTWNISKFPFERNKVWFLDQWGGWEGKLTIMDIDTKEYWQSDKVQNLYIGFNH